jgi:DNA primase
VVAALGTAVTPQHLQQIFRHTHEIVFCFDGDRAGREAAWRAAQQLLAVFRDGWQARFMFLPEGEDPDSLVRRAGKDAFIERTKTATPLSEYIYKHLEEGLDIDDAAGRARLMELARPLLKTLPDGMFKAIMYDELAGKMRMPVTTLTRPAENPEIQRASSPRSAANSPVRVAIAMLLHKPALAQDVPSVARLRSFDLPGVPLLVSLVETLRANPHLNSTSLLERYRDSEHHAHLLKLKAGWLAVHEEFDLAAEFKDALLRLSAAAAKQRSDLLLRKERREGLSANERLELQGLLEERWE